MKSKQIEYYEWHDIKIAICKEMGIEETYFRDYHLVVGGEYKDCWHIWLNYFDDVKNDTIIANDLGEKMSSKVEWLTEDGKDWAIPFVKAVYAVWDEYGIENIKYSW